MNFIDGAIPKIFGNGLLGQCATGLIRLPALLTSLTAASMVGELAIRGLSNTMQTIGFKPEKGNWISKVSEQFAQIRPYGEVHKKDGQDFKKGDFKYSALNLFIRALALSAIGIVANEFVRVVGGPAPSIYNHVLAFVGPIRIDPRSYLVSMRESFSTLSATKFF